MVQSGCLLDAKNNMDSRWQLIKIINLAIEHFFSACLQSLRKTRGGLGDFETVVRTRDVFR